MQKKHTRIVAWIGIIALLLLYAATLITAIFNFDGSGQLFRACLFASVGLPILLWIYIWLYGKVKQKDTIATFFPEQPEEDTQEKPETSE